MRELRILFTGVGRRVELIQAFRQAALRLSVALKIYGADMNGTAPALAYCDFTRKVCGMKEAGYIHELVKICDKDKIDLLIPTIDTDLLTLSENISAFCHTRVMISASEKIRLCRDKNKTSQFFVDCGLQAPMPVNHWEKYKAGFPAFIKPKDGSSSINAFKVTDEEELKVYASQIKDYVIQPFIEGTEYTIDIFCDWEGNPITIVPRVRVAVRAGEVLKTEISMDNKMQEEMIKLCNEFKPCGPLTVQLIKDKRTGKNYYIEINPRFGGGSPLSMKAGADSAEITLRLLLGERVLTKDYLGKIADRAVFSRFDQSVCINMESYRQSLKAVVFDLDDTLYSEKEYVRSGFHEIAKYLKEPNAEKHLWQFFENGQKAIDSYLAILGRSEEKENCLAVYRNHFPQIKLYPEMLKRIRKYKEDGMKLGIITDGRVEGQKNKISALQLEELMDEIIITDALGGEQFRKPCDIAFRILLTKWRIAPSEMLYIGDNPAKDFQACRQLGIRYEWKENQDGVHWWER